MESLWNLYLFVDENAVVIIMVGALMAMVCISNPISFGAGWWQLRPRSWSRGRTMHRKARREYVFNMAAQDFVDAIETRVYNGEFVRSEASELYRLLKQGFPIRNLFPNPQLLKENIKKRLGKHITPNFPDKKSERVRPKHAFEKRKA